MIQFMIDDNIIQPEVDLISLSKMNIALGKIAINNQINAIFYDLRIYNDFLIGSYGLRHPIILYKIRILMEHSHGSTLHFMLIL